MFSCLEGKSNIGSNDTNLSEFLNDFDVIVLFYMCCLKNHFLSEVLK